MKHVTIIKTLLTSAALLLMAGSVSAHHSRAVYDLQKWVTVTGTVKQWQWTNPHSALIMEVPNSKGGTDEWVMEGGSPSFLARDGWKRTDMKPGDQITVKLHPNRDGTNGGSFSQITLADGTVRGKAGDYNPAGRKRAEDEPLY